MVQSARMALFSRVLDIYFVILFPIIFFCFIVNLNQYKLCIMCLYTVGKYAKTSSVLCLEKSIQSMFMINNCSTNLY